MKSPFWAGVAIFSVGAVMQLVNNGPASPWFWGPLIPMAAVCALYWRDKRRTQS